MDGINAEQNHGGKKDMAGRWSRQGFLWLSIHTYGTVQFTCSKPHKILNVRNRSVDFISYRMGGVEPLTIIS